MADLRICPSCSAENNAGRYFCSSCGLFLRKDELSNTSKFSEQEFMMQRIVNNLPKTPHTDIFWNRTADAYCQKVERIKALLDASDEKPEAYAKITDQMKEFLELCRNPEYQIAFVGTIKTGKSTLINALLGKNYASMAVTPETAALTKFRKSPKDYVNVVFYTDSEWKTLWSSMSSAADTFINEYKALEGEKHKAKWINHKPIHVELSNDEIHKELSKWSSSKSPEHYFVKEIEVGISTLPDGFPPEVVFVDTPGLSDPVAYRSNITKNYIKKANAVFVCVDAQKVYKEELETIASVFSFSAHNKKKVHIIATHWDTMNNPIEDWKNQKDFLKTQLLGKAYYDTLEDAENNIMHSAAYIYNEYKNYKGGFLEKKHIEDMYVRIFQSVYDEQTLEKQYSDITITLPKIIECTNIDNIRRIINDRLVSKHSELMLQDLTQKYKSILSLCKRYVDNSKQDILKAVNAVNSNLESIRTQLNETARNYSEIQNSEKQLKAALEMVHKQTASRLNKILDKLGNSHA